MTLTTLPNPGDATPPSRRWLWVQLLIGWLPAWALFALLMAMTHGTPLLQTAGYAARMVAVAALLGLLVMRGVDRWPWPHPMRLRFIVLHAFAAAAYATAWVVGNSLVESLLRWQVVLVLGPGVTAFAVTGVWLYVMVAGVCYAQRAAQRVAAAQALAARSRLAALRAQLHPHFLFNALHTVVQLIPLQPAQAQAAAEQLADLLRATLDDDADIVPLQREWSLVQRYLAIEQLRLGARLQLSHDISADALAAELPSFSLQTLVENALQHAVAPRVEPTRVAIVASVSGDELVLTVQDDGGGAPATQLARSGGGLWRLRERLLGLYGARAKLELRPVFAAQTTWLTPTAQPAPTGQPQRPQGLLARLCVPQDGGARP
jgi:signal transduction histidine kinase